LQQAMLKQIKLHFIAYANYFARDCSLDCIN